MQPAVDELADRVERQLVERQQLADAREVEERVPGRNGQYEPEHIPKATPDANTTNQNPSNLWL